MVISHNDLLALDRDDPLAAMRELFALPEGVVYLDGNSLGARPRATAARIAEVVEREWGEGLIRSWNDAGWMELPRRVGDKIGRLIGAAPGSVVVADSTSVNLFKLLGAALALRPERRVILSERRNFPTDLYIAEGLAALLNQG
ncbi:MAG TPA: kynureninase, partial [Acetobacteraceae bacterium]